MAKDSFNHKKIEKKWQKVWEDSGVFEAKEKGDKFYILDMFAYPSGEGLHVGHPRGYTASDILAKYYKMQGKNVLHPFGWDAFGLPAENYAIKVGTHPAKSTAKNIGNFTKQLKSFGFGYDWSREINTSTPEYYKWTQWLFKVLYDNGYAYQKEALVNWDPVDKTVLANEQVKPDGTAERSGAKVEQKKLKQWFFKITDFAEELIDGLDDLDWPESTKAMQKNWIGRSEGAELEFKIVSHSELDSGSRKKMPKQVRHDGLKIKVFTTRPDTLFGATYMVLAPEHELVVSITTKEQKKDVDKYVEDAKHKSALDRTASKEKTGVFTGAYAINPANNEKIPIWIADYVLLAYGFGAVMAVPAHDERDFEFAKKFSLSITRVIHKVNAPIKSYLMGAENISDEDLTVLGIDIVETKSDGDRCIVIPSQKLKEYEKLIVSKLTDGFWNEYIGDEAVFLFKFKDGKIKRLVLSQETVEEIDKLADEFVGGWDKKHPWSWLAQNSWYADVIKHSDFGILENSGKFDGMTSEKAIKEITKKVGGKLTIQYKLHDWLISRQRYWGAPIPIVYRPCHPEFISGSKEQMLKQVQHDGWEPVSVDEKDLPVLLPTDVDFKPSGESPLAGSKEFQKGVETKYGKGAKRELDTLDTFVCSSWYHLRYCDPRNESEFAGSKSLKYWMPVDFYIGGAEHINGHLLYSRFITKVLHKLGYLDFDEPFLKLRHQGMIQGEDGEKMSKSKGNVVNPDEVIEQYGADTMRMYEMFIGPFALSMPWNAKGIVGIRRFLDKVWKAVNDLNGKPKYKSDGKVHSLIKKVTLDIEAMKFNTAISTMMEFVNDMSSVKDEDWTYELIQLLAPFAPHLTEEVWQTVWGNKTSVLSQKWLEFDEKVITKLQTKIIVVQEMGKLRGTIEMPLDAGEADVLQQIEQDDKLAKLAQEYKKHIFVPNRIINFISK